MRLSTFAVRDPRVMVEEGPGWKVGRIAWAGLLQASAVAALAIFLYAGLRSELPVDDVLRFTPHIAEGVYEWEVAHVFMQPAALLWHRHLGFGAPARTSQESFNAFCAGVSLGILYLLLLRLGVKPLRRILLCLLGALAFNLLSLATSGHIKLAVLPFLSLSLYHAVLWERDARAGKSGRDGRLALSAVLLGVSAAFLINSLVVAPFLGLAALAVSLRAGSGPRRALLRLVGVGLLAGSTAFLLLVAAYGLATPGAGSLDGFVGFLAKGEGIWHESTSAAESLARGFFAVIQNFFYLGDFGAMVRTWLGGDASVLATQGRTLLALGVLFAIAVALLAWIYGGALLRLLRDRGPAMPWAFVLGTLAFAVPWNLNEADFYFPITFPTVVMLAAAPSSRRRPALETALVALVAGSVLFGWALPRRDYPLQRYNAELRSTLTERDLAVLWSHWSGGPSLLFMDLPGVPQLYPDQIAYGTPDSGVVFRRVADTIDRRLADAGRVYLFEILDGRTWNAPWPRLRRKGITPARLEGFFYERYTVLDRGEMAEIRCWELRPKAGPDPGAIEIEPGSGSGRSTRAAR